MGELKINMINRRPGINYSIERVFDTIFNSLKNRVEMEKFYVPFHRILPKNLFNNLLYCKNINNGNINHITGDIHYVSLVLPRKRTILTIHDLVGVHVETGLKKVFIWLFWYYLPCKHVAKITCISEATKNDLIKTVKCKPNKVVVVRRMYK